LTYVARDDDIDRLSELVLSDLIKPAEAKIRNYNNKNNNNKRFVFIP
jgi:hypothetical protein